MAVADITNPKVTQDYTALLQSIRDLFISQAALHDGTGIVGLTAGAIRYSGTNTRFEKFDGTSWNVLPVAVSGNAGNVTGIVAGANGGTGVNNSGKTITLGGNLTTAGAFASTFTMTGATTVTFPASGKLLSDAAAVTVAQGGTGVATLTGLAYGNGTGAFSAATTAQVLATVGTIPVASGGTGATTAAAALTNLGALPLAGGVMTGPLKLPDGTQGAPSLSWSGVGDSDTGLFHIGDGIIGVVCNNVLVAKFTSAGLEVLKVTQTQ